MKLYTLRASQKLPLSLEESWSFFSNPQNLAVITPKKLNLIVDYGADEKMYPGMILTYRVRPLLSIPIQWITEITHVHEPFLFVDEQRFGPYKMWHHLHRFKEIEQGTLMEDSIHYIIPFGPLGRLMHFLSVKRQLDEIFNYRTEALKELFPE